MWRQSQTDKLTCKHPRAAYSLDLFCYNFERDNEFIAEYVEASSGVDRHSIFIRYWEVTVRHPC